MIMYESKDARTGIDLIRSSILIFGPVRGKLQTVSVGMLIFYRNQLTGFGGHWVRDSLGLTWVHDSSYW